MPAESRPAGLAVQIEQVNEATSRLLAGLDGLAAADVARPTLCPGWTVGHVLTHLARNADGLRRSADGARRGESVPMYDSAQARNHDIEAGAGRPITELVTDVTSSAAALRDAWSALHAADWEREMLHYRHGALPLSRAPMMRLGEVEIHHVDLAARFRPDGWPDSFVAHILSAAAELSGRLPDGVTLEVRATDTGSHWTASAGAGAGGGAGARGGAGAHGEAGAARRVVVAGPSWAIAGWLVGRPGPVAGALSVTGGELPLLKPWG